MTISSKIITLNVLTLLFLVQILLFLLAYKFYGSGYISRLFNLNNDNPTPAHKQKDNVDFVPTRKIILFGHHFSSIAGAGPIVGPILGGILFGWGIPLIWITLGCIFLGGVHDLTALIASVRHDGRSIANLASKYIGRPAYKAFLIFTWLSLVYVITVFTDITSTTFDQNGEVVTVSAIYVILAILFGFIIYKLKKSFPLTASIFIILVFVFLYLSFYFPLKLPPILFGSTKKTWSMIILIYAYIASVLPVWLLLQPRDFLSSYLLYSFVLVGIICVLFGNFALKYPIFTAFKSEGQSIFPMLFVTIACGAISGFHSLVASGTSSKQLNREKDAPLIGYGGMLTEGIVAFLALGTMMIFSRDEISIKGGGIDVFGLGVARFTSVLGLSPELGKTYGLLILSAFVLTTLDTATRIARYILQELLNWETKKTRFTATIITLILPLILLIINIKDRSGNIIPAYKAIWPVFGTSNQLLSALVLLAVSVWIKKIGKNNLFTLIPSFFMFIITLTALISLVSFYGMNAVGIIALILLILATYFIISSIYSLFTRKEK